MIRMVQSIQEFIETAMYSGIFTKNPNPKRPSDKLLNQLIDENTTKLGLDCTNVVLKMFDYGLIDGTYSTADNGEITLTIIDEDDYE